MLFTLRSRRFLASLLVCGIIAMPALALPRVTVTPGAMVYQPPGQTTCNCPAEGTFTSDGHTTKKVSLYVKGTKTSPTTEISWLPKDITVASSGTQQPYLGLASGNYDSTLTYKMKAVLFNSDDESIADSGWENMTPPS